MSCIKYPAIEMHKNSYAVYKLVLSCAGIATEAIFYCFINHVYNPIQCHATIPSEGEEPCSKTEPICR